MGSSVSLDAISTASLRRLFDECSRDGRELNYKEAKKFLLAVDRLTGTREPLMSRKEVVTLLEDNRHGHWTFDQVRRHSLSIAIGKQRRDVLSESLNVDHVSLVDAEDNDEDGDEPPHSMARIAAGNRDEALRRIACGSMMGSLLEVPCLHLGDDNFAQVLRAVPDTCTHFLCSSNRLSNEALAAIVAHRNFSYLVSLDLKGNTFLRREGIRLLSDNLALARNLAKLHLPIMSEPDLMAVITALEDHPTVRNFASFGDDNQVPNITMPSMDVICRLIEANRLTKLNLSPYRLNVNKIFDSLSRNTSLAQISFSRGYHLPDPQSLQRCFEQNTSLVFIGSNYGSKVESAMVERNKAMMMWRRGTHTTFPFHLRKLAVFYFWILKYQMGINVDAVCLIIGYSI